MRLGYTQVRNSEGEVLIFPYHESQGYRAKNGAFVFNKTGCAHDPYNYSKMTESQLQKHNIQGCPYLF